MKITLRLYNTDSGYKEYHDCITFSYEKERYTPYTKLSAVFYGEIDPENIASAAFYLDDKLKHLGTPDKIVCRRKDGARTFSILSYGYTMLLGQNQSEPGIMREATLSKIVELNLPIYGVSSQSSTKSVNYIYIEDKTTIWDAACVYAMKAYGTHPFINGANEIRCSKENAVIFTYDSADIVECEKCAGSANLISDAYTTDLEDNWSFSRTNSFAKERHITKRKYYGRQSDFLYDLNDQLKLRMNYADRAREYGMFTYRGYKGEDLLDKGTFEIGSLYMMAAEIDRIKIRASDGSVLTSLYFYKDPYCANRFLKKS